MVQIGNSWDEVLAGEFEKEYYQKLREFLKEEYSTRRVYPSMENIFRSLKETPYDRVKAVIIGQDPYHEPGQAHGLSFSVKPGVDIPPSLQNIYKELQDEMGCYIPNNGYLVKWARQGVLLLNAVLTVRAHAAASHQGKGWENFTDAVIREVNKKDAPVVFMLWGSFARSKKAMLDNPKHLILEAPHPSPLSAYRGFFGCNHFKRCNEFLSSNGLTPVDWQIENI